MGDEEGAETIESLCADKTSPLHVFAKMLSVGFDFRVVRKKVPGPTNLPLVYCSPTLWLDNTALTAYFLLTSSRRVYADVRKAAQRGRCLSAAYGL